MGHRDPRWCARLHAARASEDLPAGSPYLPRAIPLHHTCDRCGARMYEHSCKLVCPNCGYKRDCSDP